MLPVVRYSRGNMTISRRVNTFIHSRFFRILTIGGIGFFVQTLVFEALGFYMHLVSPSIAAIIGGELAVLTNFSLNERFSFNDRVTITDRPLLRLVRFHMVISGSLFIQWALISLTEQYTESVLLLHIAYISGVLLGFISNYIGYHLFVWKHNN